jgi:hypothetical protein
MIQDSELLRPSLTAEHSSASAIYSVRTGFLASFFGGPIGGACVALLNARSLGRLKVDWPVALLALSVSVGLSWSSAAHKWQWLDSSLGHGSGRYLQELAGLAFYGVIYTLHRPYYRSMQLLGLDPPNGLRVGIAAAALGYFAETVLRAIWITALRP